MSVAKLSNMTATGGPDTPGAVVSTAGQVLLNLLVMLVGGCTGPDVDGDIVVASNSNGTTNSSTISPPLAQLLFDTDGADEISLRVSRFGEVLGQQLTELANLLFLVNDSVSVDAGGDARILSPGYNGAVRIGGGKQSPNSANTPDQVSSPTTPSLAPQSSGRSHANTQLPATSTTNVPSSSTPSRGCIFMPSLIRAPASHGLIEALTLLTQSTCDWSCSATVVIRGSCPSGFARSKVWGQLPCLLYTSPSPRDS
eukprot:TRINITY_DN5777_c0_g1_i3.p1 TRINITY_DN5777_c0_g1~~TRINITY_DN5777_c0_g1_i3.p1  ORF type:complete len:255 (-),score=21.11 TRINITY_DN5777_c0_g1_i3:70-834(-)